MFKTKLSLVLAFVMLFAAVPFVSAAGHQTIVDIAVEDGRFDTLVAAVTATGLADALSGGVWRVLARAGEEFAELGLDVGDRRIGVALSDPDGILASPLTIIDRRDETRDLESITGLVKQHGVGRIIVGLPLSMDGGLGPQAEKVMAFTDKLCGATGVPVVIGSGGVEKVLQIKLNDEEKESLLKKL